jgi:two-component system phosphate regulon sensor histidine kinase PhoR
MDVLLTRPDADHRHADEKELSEMKNQFVSMVSHELRTPLASIKAYVEMLIDGEAVDAGTQREFYEVIQNEANRLGRLIDNILNISRIESGLARINRKPHELGGILREAVGVIAPHATQKRITIEHRVEPEQYPIVADRDMLYQAVLNLLSNAVKYTPEGGSIALQTSADPERGNVLIRIIDTGVGIPPKDLPFIFDKFYRAEANKRIAPGTGLGLSLVRHIVETVHGGRVSVESHVGCGSCFVIELALDRTCHAQDRALLAAAG